MRTSSRPRRGTRNGFTLLESMLALTLLCVVSGSVIMVSRDGSTAFDTANRSSQLESRVRRAMDRIAFELVTAIGDSIDPAPEGPNGTPDFVFTTPVDFVGGAVVPSDLMRLAWVMEQGEVDDGLDNDGDGLVDEGQVILVRDFGIAGQEITTTLCRGVAETLEGEVPGNFVDENGNGIADEAGFCVQLEDNVLVVRLSLQDWGEDGVITRTLETGVGLRN